MPKVQFVAAATAALVVVGVGLLPSSAIAVGGTSVSGTVTALLPTDEGTEESGLNNTWVRLEALRDALVDNAGWSYETYTDPSGTFQIDDVPPGQYRVFFDPSVVHGSSTFAPEWLGDSPTELGSSVITVGSTPLSGVDALLDVGATVTGTVTFSGGASGTAAAQAFLLDPTTGRPERLGGVRETFDAGPYTLSGLAPGEYIIRFSDAYFIGPTLGTEYYEGSVFVGASTTVTVGGGENVAGVDGNLGPAGIGIARIEGADRFDVSARIAELYDPAVTDTAFVTNGLNFPDALSAGPAAASLGAPVLLVSPTSIPASVASVLDDLGLTTIYVIGGPASVSPSVVSQLGAYADTVTRISGADRYEASRNVAREFWGESSGAYMATGVNFPDALAAGPAASLYQYPIVLENGQSTTLSAGTKDLLGDLGVTRVTIAGGPNSFSSALESGLASAAGIPEVHRSWGADRYSAGQAINEAFRLADTVFLATGLKFPDALAGAALAGASGAPLYLVQPDCVPVGVLQDIVRRFPAQIILLGGPATLSYNVEQLVPCS